ncbi:MAG: MMPL family transporter [Solirubrobacteraceae bacterium]
MRRPLDALMGLAARRPAPVLVVTVVLALVGAVMATRLDVSAGTDTLVGDGSDVYAATERWREAFGDDAVFVMVRGDIADTFLGEDLGRVIGLEGCISGNVPDGVQPPGGPGGPCATMAADRPVRAVYGPGTFINEAAFQLQSQFQTQLQASREQADAAAQEAVEQAREDGASQAGAQAAGEAAAGQVQAQFQQQVFGLAARYGIRGIPSASDPQFVSQLICDTSQPLCAPKERFSYLFPNAQGGADTAIIQVRLEPGLSDEQQARTIETIRAAVGMEDWRLGAGGQYLVTGAPVVVADLTDSITGSIIVLLIAAGLVMAATLALVFRTRLRLAPLAIALGAAALTFGALSLAGASLTMASIAVLPVLIGLAVDYAIQIQSRVEEARVRSAAEASRVVARAGAPTVVTAAAATAAGFLVLLLSPVPMVQGFGALLVLGIVVALALTLTAGIAALVLVRDDGDGGFPRRLMPALRGAGEMLRPLGRGALALGRPVVRVRPPAAVRRCGRAGAARLRAGSHASLELAVRHPVRVLAVGVALALAGWALDTQLEVESDITQLVPADLRALEDLETLQEASGIGGTIDVLVEGEALGNPAAIGWMVDYQQRVLDRAGFTEERGCGEAAVCPAFSLPDLLSGTTQPGQPAARPSAQAIDALLAAVPPYFSQSVLNEERTKATLSFGISLMPLDRQQEVIDEMRTLLDPPEGLEVELVGLPVLAASANAEVSSHTRRVLTLIAGLLAVALVLLVALRTPRRALLPLAPIVLATGWSALVLFVSQVPLNPMSVTLGALVIAISTEFSVLLAERFRAERARGLETAAALRRTYVSTGKAVSASGITAIAGFAVLVVSDIRMLRDFGAVTVVDLSVSLLGVLVVLPAVLVLSEHPDRLREGLRELRPRWSWLRPRRRQPA